MSQEFADFTAKGIKDKKRRLPLTRAQKWLGVSGFLILAVASWAIVASILPTQKMKESEFVEECHSAIKRQLKDPESAQIDDPLFGVHAEVDDDGDDDFSMFGTARSRNGFGGMTNFTYECSGGYSKELDRVYSIAKLEQ